MDLATARRHIETHFARMDAAYQSAVFDEWAILSAASEMGIVAYSGPRVESFRRHLAADVAPLLSAIAGRPLGAGDFEFAPDAGGTRYDACLQLGPGAYLICNHTRRAIAEIRRDPRWLKAQAVFFELSEKFRADPLSLIRASAPR